MKEKSACLPPGPAQLAETFATRCCAWGKVIPLDMVAVNPLFMWRPGWRENALTKASPMEACSRCGARLEPRHRFCWNCGAPRPPVQPEKPAATPRSLSPWVGVLTFLCAGGGVFGLVLLTQLTAYMLNPLGRLQLRQAAVDAGAFPARTDAGFALYLVFATLLLLLPAVLHSAAFLGLARRTRAGWVLGVLVSAFWSLLLVGIPFLWILLRRDTRQVFGFS